MTLLDHTSVLLIPRSRILEQRVLKTFDVYHQLVLQKNYRFTFLEAIGVVI